MPITIIVRKEVTGKNTPELHSFGDSSNGVEKKAKKTLSILVISGLPVIAAKLTTAAIPCISTFSLINTVLKKDRFRFL